MASHGNVVLLRSNMQLPLPLFLPSSVFQLQICSELTSMAAKTLHLPQERQNTAGYIFHKRQIASKGTSYIGSVLKQLP